MRRLLLAALVAGAGCASQHDLARGPGAWGGGVYLEELRPGLHYIVVKSNVAPWTNREAVAAQWQREASKLCGGGYGVLRVREQVEEHLAPLPLVVMSLPYLVTVRTGYALCASADLTTESAEQFLGSRP